MDRFIIDDPYSIPDDLKESQFISLPERTKATPDIIQRALDQFRANLRVAAPGIIQDFDPEEQTVTVQLGHCRELNCERHGLSGGSPTAPYPCSPGSSQWGRILFDCAD